MTEDYSDAMGEYRKFLAFDGHRSIGDSMLWMKRQNKVPALVQTLYRHNADSDSQRLLENSLGAYLMSPCSTGRFTAHKWMNCSLLISSGSLTWMLTDDIVRWCTDSLNNVVPLVY
ncbi:hypothetical protein ATANTOWER_012478 [Ataeniobius toweri]|uniref:Uncharacterized protein n=1 Tax=Ataeniobius toweri TaxID=208326 RepID=A0ABU7AAA3_9TELE|nr:hypothetical protein [Ataeniobius toweri]